MGPGGKGHLLEESEVELGSDKSGLLLPVQSGSRCSAAHKLFLRTTLIILCVNSDKREAQVSPTAFGFGDCNPYSTFLDPLQGESHFLEGGAASPGLWDL